MSISRSTRRGIAVAGLSCGAWVLFGSRAAGPEVAGSTPPTVSAETTLPKHLGEVHQPDKVLRIPASPPSTEEPPSALQYDFSNPENLRFTGRYISKTLKPLLRKAGLEIIEPATPKDKNEAPVNNPAFQFMVSAGGPCASQYEIDKVDGTTLRVMWNVVGYKRLMRTDFWRGVDDGRLHHLEGADQMFGERFEVDNPSVAVDYVIKTNHDLCLKMAPVILEEIGGQ